MQGRIAQGRLDGDPPDGLITPRLEHFGSFEYHRAALAIAEGHAAVARMLPAIWGALAA